MSKQTTLLNDIGQRVRALRHKLGISQTECSDRMGFARNYISMIENGRNPSPKFIRLLEQFEQGQLPDMTHKPDGAAFDIPLLSWVQAGTKEAWDKVDNHEASARFNVADPKAVAVEIRGDSMAPQFPQGTIAFVYPSSKAKSGDLVIARLNDGTVMFKRLHVDGNHYTFISLNPIYPPVTLDKAKIERILPVGGTFQNHL